ncbi:MAG: hypothetical protein MK137_06790 [Rickettsiales bacterium]|nr:hypothetical protein [Rickettsiales bacterium]
MSNQKEANDNQYDETKQNIWGPILLYSIFVGLTVALYRYTAQSEDVFHAKLAALLPFAVGSNACAIAYKYFIDHKVNKIIIFHLYASFLFLSIAFFSVIGTYGVLALLFIYCKPWYHYPTFSISLIVSLCIFLNLILLGSRFFNFLGYVYYYSSWVFAVGFVVFIILYKSRKNVSLGKKFSPLITAPYRSLFRPLLIWGLFLTIILTISSIYEHGASIESSDSELQKIELETMEQPVEGEPTSNLDDALENNTTEP